MIPVDSKAIEAFFFKFMLAGYTSQHESEIITHFPGDKGAKCHSHGNSEGFSGLDEWWTTDLGRGSGGMTTIFFNGSPIWQMHYQGSYPGTCISFLKEALTSSYRNEVWLGGRGPNVFNKDKWTYKNTPGSHCGFTNFDGSEVIINRNTGKIVGEHRYFGGSFLH